MITKICKKCKKELDIELFTIVKKNSDNRSGSCKSCDNEVKKKNLTPEIARERYLRWKAKHPDGLQKSYLKAKQREGFLEKSYNQTKKYRLQRPGWMATQCAKRRAKKLQATVKWDVELTNFVSEESHHLRGLRDFCTKITWNVDHIIPLQGKIFSGLHTWNNLQVIPKSTNVQKGNRVIHEYKWSEFFKTR